jgi:hypothetical protein
MPLSLYPGVAMGLGPMAAGLVAPPEKRETTFERLHFYIFVGVEENNAKSARLQHIAAKSQNKTREF